MTANEMKFNFQLKFDSLFEFSSPAYDDRQISWLLTEAQFRVFIKRYNPLGDKYREGFEDNERRRRDLEQLIESASIAGGQIAISADQDGVHPNGTFYDLPDGFLYATEESAITSEIPGEEVYVKPVKHDQYRANIRHPFKRPYHNLVWRMDYSRQTHALGTATDATNKRTELIVRDSGVNPITDYRVVYLRTPPDIVVDETALQNQVHCILDETLHREIVDEAVVIADAAVKKDEYQVSLNEKERSQ